MKTELPPFPAIYPAPVTLVSCHDPERGADSIITISWSGVAASTPPYVTISIRPSRHSHRIITATKEFVLNIPSEDQVGNVQLCGTKSGADTDKFKACGFTKDKCRFVTAPQIRECLISLECQVRNIVPLGSHDLFIAEVRAVHVDERALLGGTLVDCAVVKPLTYAHGEFWNLGHRISPRS